MKRTIRHLRYMFLLLVIGLLMLPATAQRQDTLKVLFVGNSYTYFWNLPQTFAAMGTSKNIPIVSRKSTAGGTTLKQHWNGDKGLKSRELIEGSSWDVVVLQNHSLSTIKSSEEFMEYGKRFIDLVRKTGATPILYMTWARESNPLMLGQISEGYRTLAESEQVSVVPVGEVWERARSLKPLLRLYDPDGSHPSTIGTYLTSLVFFKALTNQKVEGIPNRLSTIDKNGEELFLSIMSKDDVHFMEQLVDSFEPEIHQTNGK